MTTSHENALPIEPLPARYLESLARAQNTTAQHDTNVRRWLAAEMGYTHGHNVGTWAIDGNTTAETCRRIIDGYDDGDPEVLDMCPAPLSGEFADDPSANDVLRSLGVGLDDDGIPVIGEYEADELLDSYEFAFIDGFWAEVQRAALAVIA